MNSKSIFKKSIVVILISAFFIAGFIACFRFFTSNSKSGRSFDAKSVPHSQIPYEITSTITLNGKKVNCDKKYVSQVSNVAMITEGGNYCIEGYLDDGQIRVFTADEEVTLILNGVDLRCLNMAPIYVESASNVTVYVPDTTTNSITCAEIGTYESALEAATYTNNSTNEASAETSENKDTPVTKKGVIVSECNLSFKGGGTLDVFGYMRNGIHARDSLYLEDTTINLTTTNNGIKATNDIIVTSGHYDLASVGDGLQADGNLTINGGTFNITTGQGSASIEKKSETPPAFDGAGMSPDAAFGNSGMPPMPPANANFGDSGMPPAPPANANFGDSGMRPEPPADANFGDSNTRPEPPADATIDDSDDSGDSDDSANSGSSEESKKKTKKSEKLSRKAIKASDTLMINDGSITIDSADDGIHADNSIVINGGSIQIASSDDAVHADNSLIVTGGKLNITDCCEGIESINIDISGGDISVVSTDDGINASGKKAEPIINISGGKIYVNAEGDGIDSNKNIVITGGEVYVDGPSNSGNAAIDVGFEDGGMLVIKGGIVTALGMSDMLDVADESSTQQSLTFVFDEYLNEGGIITIIDNSGNLVSQLTLKKNCDSIIFSSPDLITGETYTFTCGDVEGTLEATEINATNHESFQMNFPGPTTTDASKKDSKKDSKKESKTDSDSE